MTGPVLSILLFFDEPPVGLLKRVVQLLKHRMSFLNDVLLVDPINAERAHVVVEVLLNGLDPGRVLRLHLDSNSVFTRALFP